MKSAFFSCVLAVCLPFAATASACENAEAAVIAADRALNAAIMAGDTQSAATFYLDDFLLTTSAGGAKTKADMLKEIGSPHLELSVNETLAPQVRVHGEAAVLTGQLHQKGTYQGRMLDARLLVTDTWIRTPQGWRLLSGHASPAPAAP